MAMDSVVLAHDLKHDRREPIKILRPEVSYAAAVDAVSEMMS